MTAQRTHAPEIEPMPGVLGEEVLGHLLDVELARARRYDHPFALIRVRVLDAAGPALRRAAGALRLHTRWADSVGWSGGALLVILRDTPPQGARIARDKLETSVVAELAAGAPALAFDCAAWRKGDDLDRLLARLG